MTDPWLAQIAKATVPYLDARRIPDGEWIRLEKPDGTAMSVRLRNWPEIERLALEIRNGGDKHVAV